MSVGERRSGSKENFLFVDLVGLVWLRGEGGGIGRLLMNDSVEK